MTEFQLASWTTFGMIVIFSSMKFVFMCSDKQDKKGWRLGVLLFAVSFFATSHLFNLWHDICAKNNNYLTFESDDGKFKIKTLSPFSKPSKLEKGDLDDD